MSSTAVAVEVKRWIALSLRLHYERDSGAFVSQTFMIRNASLRTVCLPSLASRNPPKHFHSRLYPSRRS